MEAVGERMHNRNERLTEKCSEYGLNVRRNDSLHRPNPWEFLVNKRFHLIWCNVFKAASTSWMYNFNILAGYSPRYLRKTNTVPLELARKRYERVTIEQVNGITVIFPGENSYSKWISSLPSKQLEKAMNTSITFLIVRHPFERLLSAYRDKIMFAIPHSLHDRLGHKIIRKYRKNVSWTYPTCHTTSIDIEIVFCITATPQRSKVAIVFRICELSTRRNESNEIEAGHALGANCSILYAVSNQIRYYCEIRDTRRGSTLFDWTGSAAKVHCAAMEEFGQREEYTRIDTEILFTVDQSTTWWTLWYLQVSDNRISFQISHLINTVSLVLTAVPDMI